MQNKVFYKASLLKCINFCLLKALIAFSGLAIADETFVYNELYTGTVLEIDKKGNKCKASSHGRLTVSQAFICTCSKGLESNHSFMQWNFAGGIPEFHYKVQNVSKFELLTRKEEAAFLFYTDEAQPERLRYIYSPSVGVVYFERWLHGSVEHWFLTSTKGVSSGCDFKKLLNFNGPT